ncbi:uncharacterized protein [Diadema antillarum]|uniref:uncharacterized protein n=1 Tax=Diadema antillarum TaxID=105358 RepID=UPI003A851F6C
MSILFQFLDASWADSLASITFSLEPDHRRSLLEYKLERLWNRNHPAPYPILPCLSVRTAFDVFLSAKRYPPGSEIIFSAINIPQMTVIARHHGLKVVPLDINAETLAPKVEYLASLINPKTVAILVAHIYGHLGDIDTLIQVARQHKLTILEDCAESFSGTQNHGHPGADVTFFSFGIIKTCTAFGGAIAVVRDPALREKMRTLYHSYPVQSRSVYLSKVLKYSAVMTIVNSPTLTRFLTQFLSSLGLDHREIIIKHIRGFPTNFIDSIRMKPNVTLLYMMYRKLLHFDTNSFMLGNIKAEFVSERLPQEVKQLGLKAKTRNYWLFPVLVSDPERVVRELNARGVDAYRGATQLNLVEFDPPSLGPDPRLAAPHTHSEGVSWDQAHHGESSSQKMPSDSSGWENKSQSTVQLSPRNNAGSSHMGSTPRCNGRIVASDVAFRGKVISNKTQASCSAEEEEEEENTRVVVAGRVGQQAEGQRNMDGVGPLDSLSSSISDSAAELIPRGQYFSSRSCQVSNSQASEDHTCHSVHTQPQGPPPKQSDKSFKDGVSAPGSSLPRNTERRLSHPSAFTVSHPLSAPPSDNFTAQGSRRLSPPGRIGSSQHYPCLVKPDCCSGTPVPTLTSSSKQPSSQSQPSGCFQESSDDLHSGGCHEADKPEGKSSLAAPEGKYPSEARNWAKGHL